MYLSSIHKITREDGEEFAEQNLALFAETSALTASNVEEIFIEISEFVCNSACYCVHLHHHASIQHVHFNTEYSKRTIFHFTPFDTTSAENCIVKCHTWDSSSSQYCVKNNRSREGYR